MRRVIIKNTRQLKSNTFKPFRRKFKAKNPSNTTNSVEKEEITLVSGVISEDMVSKEEVSSSKTKRRNKKQVVETIDTSIEEVSSSVTDEQVSNVSGATLN